MRHSGLSPLDDGSDERLTFDDVTALAVFAVGCAVFAVVVMLGLSCALHRIEGVVSLL